MSSEITTAFVKQYGENVFHLSQQKGSRLQGAVRNETQQGKARFFDRLGKTAAIKKNNRHGDTPLVESAHSRRMVTLVDYEWADLIDDQDKIRTLISPESIYAQAAMWALGRSKDDEIISAATGNAYSGEDGTTAVSLPNSQKIGANDGTNATSLNVRTLRQVQEVFGENDVDEDEMRFIAVSQKQITNMLGETEVTSSDFNTVKALVQGEVDTFLGFNFIRTQRLETQSGTLSYDTDGSVGSGGLDADGHEKCFAWAMSGLLLSTAKDMQARIDERSDKSYSTQVYACLSIGATRMEEEKVCEVLCDL